jgi:hypothetical protein
MHKRPFRGCAARPGILYNATESLESKPGQCRLERLAARVVEDQCGVDAAWMGKFGAFRSDSSE